MDAKKQDPPTVEERLAKLEKQNRRLKLAGIAALVLVGAVVLVGATVPKPKTVEADKLVVRDGQGKARAELVVTEEGPSLRLYDAEGKTRAELAILEDGPCLVLHTPDHKRHISLSAYGDEPELTIFDEKGDPIGMLQEDALRFWDGNGTNRAVLGMDFLALFYSNGKVAWQEVVPE